MLLNQGPSVPVMHSNARASGRIVNITHTSCFADHTLDRRSPHYALALLPLSSPRS